MAQLPKKRKTDEELEAIAGEARRQPLPPNAAVGKLPSANDLPLSVSAWLLTLIVLTIPILNLVLYVYWAFFSKGNVSRINFCRASLILIGSMIVLLLALGAVLRIGGA